MPELNSIKVFLKTFVYIKLIKQSLLNKFCFENFNKDNIKKNFVFFNKFIIILKNKSLRLLKKFYRLVFKKFKLRPKLKRLILNVRVKKQFKSLKKKIKTFARRFLNLLKVIKIFLYSNLCESYIESNLLQELKSLLYFDLNLMKKNFYILGWLRVFLSYFP